MTKAFASTEITLNGSLLSSDNAIPTPVFSETRTYRYARLLGSDETGDGLTEETAYRTFQRVIRDVPNPLPPRVRYYVDCTGIGEEELPANFGLPSWKSPHSYSAEPEDFDNPYWFVNSGVNLFADPTVLDTIVMDDILPQVVGGVVSDASNTTPIVITTSLPSGLSEGAEVDITGVTGNTAANGTFSVVPLTSTTFELVDSVGDGAYAGGGTVETLFVQNLYSGNVSFKTSKDFDADELVGKGCVNAGGPFSNSIVYANTGGVGGDVFLTINFIPTLPLQITEPSATLLTTNTTFGFAGGFNVLNVDSLAINGFAIRSLVPGERGLVQFGGQVWYQGCVLEEAVFNNPTRVHGLAWTHVTSPVGESYYDGSIYHDRCLHTGLIENWLGSPSVNGGALMFNGSVYDGCAAIGPSIGTTFLEFHGVIVRNAPGDSIVQCSGHSTMENVFIENGGADAINVLGGRMTISGNVGGTWAGTALVVDQGGQVEVGENVFTGVGDDMEVGGLPARTFVDFRVPATGGFALQQLDVTAFNADPATFGASGTCSRVWQAV